MNKRKFMIVIIALIVIAALIYYFRIRNSGVGMNPNITNEDNKTGSTTVDSERTLVVYFSHSGNTQKLAKEISDQVGGDFRRIEEKNPYPTGNSLYSYTKDEQEKDARPEMKPLDIDMSDYDTIFIGYPIWWYTYPQIILTFFDKYDVTGKTIVPFVTHGGSGMSGTEQNMSNYLNDKNVTVLDGLAVRDRDMSKDQSNTVTEWLNRLEIKQK
ncbi:flavodoxin [Anaeromicropila herbilytica]|uniref:Flavodoxin-like domain-containing protein n=1 Tax=Anaeromicropila herbilytica TaxID=2785025 RepID=A0A7R7ELF3_9FIRM|nr:flavodoxin [Anaeromicropila herbilytica]BCN31046.1 hypothetical protein bsdtb5_23410 [Anaeromicropila herbilytica]